MTWWGWVSWLFKFVKFFTRVFTMACICCGWWCMEVSNVFELWGFFLFFVLSRYEVFFITLRILHTQVHWRTGVCLYFAGVVVLVKCVCAWNINQKFVMICVACFVLFFRWLIYYRESGEIGMYFWQRLGVLVLGFWLRYGVTGSNFFMSLLLCAIFFYCNFCVSIG